MKTVKYKEKQTVVHGYENIGGDMVPKSAVLPGHLDRERAQKKVRTIATDFVATEVTHNILTYEMLVEVFKQHAEVTNTSEL